MLALLFDTSTAILSCFALISKTMAQLLPSLSTNPTHSIHSSRGMKCLQCQWAPKFTQLVTNRYLSLFRQSQVKWYGKQWQTTISSQLYDYFGWQLLIHHLNGGGGVYFFKAIFHRVMYFLITALATRYNNSMN